VIANLKNLDFGHAATWFLPQRTETETEVKEEEN
jgi:hypothetical protein